MRKETFTVKDHERKEHTVLGVRIDEHFALTHPPDVLTGEAVTEGLPDVLTHLPTGCMLRGGCSKAVALAIVKAVRALPVDWTQADEKAIVRAVERALAPSDPRQWLDAFTDEAKPKRKPASVAEQMLASPLWRGATVTNILHELAESHGDCTKGDCPLKHVTVVAPVRRRGRVSLTAVRRHFELVPCLRLEHPKSGAVAIVRAP